MRFRTEIRIWLGTLVALTLVVSLAGISLLGRTGPAVRHILQDNEASLAACETMLAVLAEHPGPVPAAAEQRYRRALAHARKNVTHPGEKAPLATLARLLPTALAGPGPARRRTVRLLTQVTAINRAEMERKDRWAQRLATAGSWALVVLGLLGVLLGILGFRRILRRVILPLRELEATLAAARAGDAHRRAHLTEAPVDLVALAGNLNAVLDRLPIARSHRSEEPL